MLNATTGTDPQDVFTVTADADHKRPENWKESLDAGALKGKKIGFIPESFVSSYADDDTGQAVKNKFSELQAAGAEMVEMSKMPAAPTRPAGINGSTEGWARYIELHKAFPYPDGASVLASDKALIYNQRGYTAPTRIRNRLYKITSSIERTIRMLSKAGWMRTAWILLCMQVSLVTYITMTHQPLS
nr:hypothetical protein [Paenibacillus tritici]